MSLYHYKSEKRKEGRRNTRARESVLFSEAISLDAFKTQEVFVIPPHHKRHERITYAKEKEQIHLVPGDRARSHTRRISETRFDELVFFLFSFFLEMTLSKCHRWFPFKGCSSYDFTSRSVPVRDFYTSLYFKTKFVDHSDGSRRDVKDNRIDNYFTQL